MPFRRLYERLGSKHAEAYNLLTLAAGAIACMLVSILISVSFFHRAEAERDAQAEQGRIAACLTITRMAEVYADADTEVGKNAYRAWTGLSEIFRCEKG